jgi:hypothetical protein
MTSHVALLGDSIFDNKTYTRGEPDVISHLRAFLPAPWRASLLAVDGSRCRDLAQQLMQVTPDVTRVVISIGGNDVIQQADILNLPVSSTLEALRLFGERAAAFEVDYRAAIRQALVLKRPINVCTIYNGNLGEREAPIARVGLMPFNDVIVRVAHEHRLPIIDLRLVCTEPSDYANPIEPSGSGGRKIALAIATSLGIDPQRTTMLSRQR